MFPEKSKRSSRRFHRRIASWRRHMLRQIRRDADTASPEPDRILSRVPTVQEKRIDEAFRQDLREVEVV